MAIPTARRPVEPPNTTSWVDVDYARRLQRLAVRSVAEAGDDDQSLLDTLKGVRRHRNYIAEKPCTYGFGVPKVGARVYIVGADPVQECLRVAALDYDRSGKLIVSSAEKPSDFRISQHALQRLYERLRTNSFRDVRCAIAGMVTIAPPVLERWMDPVEMSAHVPGLGTFVLASQWTEKVHSGKLGCAWVVVTFVAEKPTASPIHHPNHRTAEHTSA